MEIWSMYMYAMSVLIAEPVWKEQKKLSPPALRGLSGKLLTDVGLRNHFTRKFA
jgi:hypothetical protein